VLSTDLSRRVQQGQSLPYRDMSEDQLTPLLPHSWVCLLDAQEKPLAIAAPQPQLKQFKLMRVFNC